MDNSKKILFLTVLPIWSLGNKSGGKALFSTIDYYLKNGYEVFLITDKKVDNISISINEDNLFYIDTSFFENKIKYKKIGLLFRFAYVFYFKFMAKQIFKKINKNNLLVYSYEVHTVSAGKAMSKKWHLPFITRFQGTTMANKKVNFINKLRFYPHLQALSTKADLVIMTNDGTQGDKVLKHCHNDSTTMFIRNGVNILDNNITELSQNFIHEKNKMFGKEKILLLTVSRLENWKKVERSINAIAFLNNKKYHLLIIGDGNEMSNLINLTKTLNISDQVTFAGAVPNKDVYKYMMMSDIFLSFYDLSNVGNPLLEALCLGKPIITYNVGDTNMIIDGKNGIILDDVSPNNIANKIKSLSKEDLEYYSKNAKKYANENLYSWEKRMKIEEKGVGAIYDKYY